MAAIHSTANANRRAWRWWRFQFGLRSLLGLVVLACCVMGAWRIWIRPYEVQHHAIEEMAIYLDDLQVEPGRPEFLRPLFKPAVFQDVTHLESSCRDIDLAHVANFPRLRHLKLSGSGVTDSGLVHLAGLTQLETLWLDNTRVSEAGLVHLSRLKNLKSLNLGYTRVHGSGLVHLSGLTNLVELNLNYLAVEDEHLGCLSGLTDLERLSLKQTDICGSGLAVLRKLPNLKRLGVTSEWLDEVNLCGLPVLEAAYFSGAVLGHVRYLVDDCPELDDLHIGGGVADIMLRKLPKIEEFSLIDARCVELDRLDHVFGEPAKYMPSSAAVTLIDLPKLEMLHVNLAAHLSLELRQLPALTTLQISQADGLKLNCQELPSLCCVALQNGALDGVTSSPPAQLPNVRSLEIDNVTLRQRSGKSPEEPLLRLLENLPDVERISIGGSSLSGVSLRPFVTCPRLRRVELRQMEIDDSRLAQLAEFASLRSLAVNDCRFRPGALRCLERVTQLEELEFSETRLKDTEVAALSNLLGLKKLSFQATGISSDAFVYLYCLPNLEEVNFPVSSRNSMKPSVFAGDIKEFVVDYEFIPSLAELQQFSKALPPNCHVVSLATNPNGMSIYELVGGKSTLYVSNSKRLEIPHAQPR